jgi:hypothetical protein
MGMGPMTGRAAGFCAGYNTPGYANPAFGRGYGMGRGICRGGGRGWRNQFYATGLPGFMPFAGGYPHPAQPDPEQEKLALKSQAQALKAQADAIQKRLEELEKAGK